MEKLQGSGLNNIYLEDGYTLSETSYGQGIAITEIENLYQAIAETLCLGAFALSPAAFKFLRKRIELTQDSLGAELGCSGQAVAKWEKGETDIPVASARLLRVLVMKKLFPSRTISESLTNISIAPMGDLIFTNNGFEWSEKNKLVHHNTIKWSTQAGKGVAAIFNVNAYTQTNDGHHESIIEGENESEPIAA